jgi:hypothetical protein
MDINMKNISKKITEHMENILQPIYKKGCDIILNGKTSIRMKYSENISEEDKKNIRDSIINNKQEIINYLNEIDKAGEMIRYWLSEIDETDQEIIKETMDRCKRDPMVRKYFLERSRKH